MQHSLNPVSAALLSVSPRQANKHSSFPVAASSGSTCQPLETNAPSRRLRLWDLAARLHCPIIGVCFSCADIRNLMRRIPETKAMSDFELHTSVVCASGTRNDGSRMVDRELNQRYKTAIQSIAPIRCPEELLARWREDVQDGRVAGALWATLTHPMCDATTENEIYAEIHLLQHQNAALTRNTQRIDRAERDELKNLREKLQEHKTRATQSNFKYGEQIRELTKELDQLKIQHHVMNREQVEAQRYERIDTAELSRVNLSLEAELQSLRRDQTRLQLDYDEQQERYRNMESQYKNLLREHKALATPGDGIETDDNLDELADRFNGQKFLCVGGMPRSVVSYRQVIEKIGARFDHHDGGKEQALNRLDPALSGADLVICQASHVSHSAYWRVKKYCRRTGKPCVYLESPGIQSFLQGISKFPMHQLVDVANETETATTESI